MFNKLSKSEKAAADKALKQAKKAGVNRAEMDAMLSKFGGDPDALEKMIQQLKAGPVLKGRSSGMSTATSAYLSQGTFSWGIPPSPPPVAAKPHPIAPGILSVRLNQLAFIQYLRRLGVDITVQGTIRAVDEWANGGRVVWDSTGSSQDATVSINGITPELASEGMTVFGAHASDLLREQFIVAAAEQLKYPLDAIDAGGNLLPTIVNGLNRNALSPEIICSGRQQDAAGHWFVAFEFAFLYDDALDDKLGDDEDGILDVELVPSIGGIRPVITPIPF